MLNLHMRQDLDRLVQLKANSWLSYDVPPLLTQVDCWLQTVFVYSFKLRLKLLVLRKGFPPVPKDDQVRLRLDHVLKKLKYLNYLLNIDLDVVSFRSLFILQRCRFILPLSGCRSYHFWLGRSNLHRLNNWIRLQVGSIVTLWHTDAALLRDMTCLLTVSDHAEQADSCVGWHLFILVS